MALVTLVFIKTIFIIINNFIKIILLSQRDNLVTSKQLCQPRPPSKERERMPIIILICGLCFTKSVIRTLKWTEWATR